MLVLPGILHRHEFNKSLAPQLLDFKTFSLETVWVFIASVVLHLIWIAICAALSGVSGLQVNLDAAMYFLSGSYAEAATFRQALHTFTQYPWQVALYFLSLGAFAAYSGFWLQQIIRRRGWDLRYRILRFNNPWHYYFHGETTDLDDGTDATRWIHAGTAVSGIVDTSGGPYLYVGILYDYFFDRAGNLDHIVLTGAFRRALWADRGAHPAAEETAPAEGETFSEGDNGNEQVMDQRYYEIDGNFVVLKYSDMRTLNLKYLRVSVDE